MKTNLIQPLHVLVGRHAADRGADLAYADADAELTWAQLWERSGRWAGHLAAAGVGRGDRVVIGLPDQVLTIVVWLAVHRASAVAVPVDPSCGRAHLDHVVRDSAAAIGVVTGALADRLTGSPLPLVVVDRNAASVDEREPATAPRDDLLLDEPAFLLYTSGTTGTPKGVVSTQRSCLWSVAAAYSPILGLDAESRVVWPLPLHHSFSHIYAILGVLATGARCRLVSGLSADDVIAAVVDHEATVLAGVPTLYGRIVHALREHRRAMPSLRTCVVSGAAGPSTLPDDFAELTGRTLVNSYGSTEMCGPITTNWPDAPGPPGSCGLPVPGVTVRIVDPETGLDVGVGMEGEVWVDSPGRMLGYHGLAEATDRALDGGYYHTGDLAHRDELGFVHLHGRRDDLIIRGGVNMHPAELEDVLRTVPGVADAAVTGRPDDDLGQVPVAFLVPSGEVPETAAILDVCRRELGPAKVPAELYLVDDLPRTASGKVMRRRLDPTSAIPLPIAAAPEPAAPVRSRVDAGQPDADLGRELVALVERTAAGILGGSEPHGEDVSLRDRGLDSRGAVRMRDALGAATGLRLPAGIVFDHPTPRRLAAHLHERLRPGRGRRPNLLSPSSTSVDEPIAIVGMACRYPGGVASPDDLWEVARAGRDVLAGFPGDRGWTVPADMPARGGFLADAGGFDAEFFGISPREALVMDPQQRLLLEVSWEALENAGIDPTSLRGEQGGVFTGLMTHDYVRRDGGIPDEALGHVETGNAGSVASGRVAYVLGLEGPALTVDTACSSSLVALHLAVQAVRRGECTFALAGGVTVMATPTVFVDLYRQGALSPSGRIRPFSADADGTAWSEGVGVLVVERLSVARGLGHPVLALVRGSGVNQDGASNGLSAPSGVAQQRVIRAALGSAGLDVSDVDVVEAHGTGTVLGDPIEAEALLATYGQRAGEPLRLGSVKSCIGHTQAAAGVAGVITMVAAVRAGELPATGATGTPSDLVDWDAGAVELLSHARPWPRGTRPRRAGVSSFGISGTNAHVIIEEAPRESAPVASVSGPFAGSRFAAIPVSARSEAALAEYVERVSDVVLRDGAVPAALATRPRFDHRSVLLGVGPESDSVSSTVVTGGDAGVVFVFGGQGSQWVGMGRELLGSSPVFARRLGECDVALREWVGFSVVEVVREGSSLGGVGVVQPVLFAVMVALGEVWRSCGVVPSGVVGHSQGEVAAACVAGLLSLEDAARVVGVRSRLVEAVAGSGGMVVVDGGLDAVEGLVERCGVSVAAVNGPASVVVSGSVGDLREFVAGCEGLGVRARWVDVDYASHSPAVDVVRDGLRVGLAGVGVGAESGVAFYSSVVGDVVDPSVVDGEYWFRNLRERVRFGDAVGACVRDGFRLFVEVGPHPVVAGAVGDVAAELGVDVGVGGTLRRGEGGVDRFVRSLAQAWVLGVPVRWEQVLSGLDLDTEVVAPTYPFQHQRYWLEPGPATARRPAFDDWCYGIDWTPLAEPDLAPPTGTWVVAGLRHPDADLVRTLEAHGVRVVALDPTTCHDLPHDADRVVLDAGTGDTCAELVAAASALLRAAGTEAAPWILTRGAVRTGAGDPAPEPAQAAMWGFAAAAGVELATGWGGVVDVPPNADTATWERACAAIAADSPEHELAVRTGTLLARRLVRSPLGTADHTADHTADRTADWRGTALITGGTGAIGAELACELAARGVEHLVLVSRRGPDAPGTGELVARLYAAGASVTVAACDVADRDALIAVLADLPADRPLRAVFHAAGTSQRPDPTNAEIAAVLAAKVDGACHLDELTAGCDLDAFVVFSSAAAVWGGIGATAYAAANAYLDGFAAQRRQSGRPALSVAWGSWAGGAAEDTGGAVFDRAGLRPMPGRTALAALFAAIDTDRAGVVVADVDWGRFAPTYSAARRRPLIEGVAEAAAALADTPAEAGADDLVRSLAALPVAERDRHLLRVVREHLASVLGHPDTENVPPDRPFRELGVDSLTTVELRNHLRRVTGLRLPSTVVFDHPSATALARHLRESLWPAADPDAELRQALDAVETHLATADAPALARRLRELAARLDRRGGDTGIDLDDASDEELVGLIGSDYR